MRSLISLSVLIFIIYFNFGYTQEQLDLVQLKDSLIKTTAILLDENISVDTKSLEVAKAFKVIDSACTSSCEQVVGLLQEFNRVLKSDNIEYVYKTLRLESIASQKDLEKFKTNIFHLHRYLETTDKKEASYKVSSALELMRYVLTIYEKDLLKLTTKGENKEEAFNGLKRDFLLFKKQLLALYDIGEVLKNSNADDLSKLSKNDMLRIINDINELGLFYMKLVQSISNNALVFSPEQKELLKFFQDDIKPMSKKEVLEIIKKEFGKDAHELFIDFDAEKPIAAGTIAQTYEAKIKTRWWQRPKDVVVKVQRPGLSDTLKWNSKTNTAMLKLLSIVIPKTHVPFLDMFASQVVGLEKGIEGETDFIQEENTLKKFANFFGANSSVKVPKVYSELSGKTVLTMERVPGVNVDRLLTNELSSGDVVKTIEVRKKLFNDLLESFLYQSIVTKEMHADLHPGNILADGTGRLSMIDWGQTFKTKGLIAAPFKLILNTITGDEEGVVNALELLSEKKTLNKEKMTELVRKHFKNEGVEKIVLKDFIANKEEERFSKQMENRLVAIKNIFSEAIKNEGYAITGGYLQFFRSALPLFTTLSLIAKEIPEKEIQDIIRWQILTFYPKGVVKFAAGKSLELLNTLSKKIKVEGIGLLNSPVSIRCLEAVLLGF